MNPILKLEREQKKAQKAVDKFNKKYPVGTKGMLIKDSGKPVETEVVREASLICGSAMAWFKGVSGAYDITRFKGE